VTPNAPIDGREGRSTRSDDAAASKWPVLARLPWVGGPSDVQDSQSPVDSLSAGYAAGRMDISAFQSSPALRIASVSAEVRRDHVDRAHVDSPTYGITPDSAAAKPSVGQMASEHRYRRIDAGRPGKPGLRVLSSAPMAPHTPSPSLAAQALQWRSLVAPYAGIAVTFLLALFAGLMYWSTLGRPLAGLPGEDDQAPSWLSASELVKPLNQGGGAGMASTYDVPEIPLSSGAAIRLNLAPIDSSAESLGVESQQPMVADQNAAGPAVDAVNDDDTLPHHETSPAVINEPVAVDKSGSTARPPAPISSPPTVITYPTTPFASFDVGLLTPADGFQLPGVAPPQPELPPTIPAPGSEGISAVAPH
jgi:hypothetical protein